MPKSRNRGGHKGATRQVLKKSRGIIAAIQELAHIGNQHAMVINSQRDRLAKQDLRIQLLEEKVYATLTPEERERLADIIDPQPADEQPAATPSEPAVLDGEVVADAAEPEGLPSDPSLEPAVEEKPAA